MKALSSFALIAVAAPCQSLTLPSRLTSQQPPCGMWMYNYQTFYGSCTPCHPFMLRALVTTGDKHGLRS